MRPSTFATANRIDMIWKARAPIILASRSAARSAVLTAAGIPHDLVAADVDERTIEDPLQRAGAAPQQIALHLARIKAMYVSEHYEGRLVLGADQVLSLSDECFSKPQDRAQAERQLLALRGREHCLNSAICLMCDGKVLYETVAIARLGMRRFSKRFLTAYLDAGGDQVLSSVGCYQIEGIGIQLFDRVEGDQSVILGLPILPLLAFMREYGLLLA